MRRGKRRLENLPGLKRDTKEIPKGEGNRESQKVYLEALNSEATLHLSTWNIGEIIGALGKYHRRGWLEEEDHRITRSTFATEMTRLIKLGITETIPVKSSLLASSWQIMERHNINQADALQITSAKSINAEKLLTGEQRLAEASETEELNATYLG